MPNKFPNAADECQTNFRTLRIRAKQISARSQRVPNTFPNRAASCQTTFPNRAACHRDCGIAVPNKVPSYMPNTGAIQHVQTSLYQTAVLCPPPSLLPSSPPPSPPLQPLTPFPPLPPITPPSTPPLLPSSILSSLPARPSTHAFSWAPRASVSSAGARTAQSIKGGQSLPSALAFLPEFRLKDRKSLVTLVPFVENRTKDVQILGGRLHYLPTWAVKACLPRPFTRRTAGCW